MLHFERTKKIISILFVISILALILAVVGFFYGGGEVIIYGYMNEPGPSIFMFVSVGISIIAFLTGLGFRAVIRDTTEEIKMLENRLGDQE